MKVVANNPVVTSIAELLGKTPAQVALRWGIQQGQSVLPKSANESRLKENIGLFGWSIPDELCAKFSEVEQVKPFFSYLSEAQKMQYSRLFSLVQSGYLQICMYKCCIL